MATDLEKTKIGSKIKLLELDLVQWCQIDEAIHVAATDEEYRKYAGIDR